MRGGVRPNRRKFPPHLACTQLKVKQASKRPKEWCRVIAPLHPSGVLNTAAICHARLPCSAIIWRHLKSLAYNCLISENHYFVYSGAQPGYRTGFVRIIADTDRGGDEAVALEFA